MGRKLYLQIYLAFLAIGLATVLGTGLLVRASMADDERPSQFHPVIGRLLSQLVAELPDAREDLPGLRRRVRELSERTGLELLVVDDGGGQLAKTGDRGFPPPPNQPGGQHWRVDQYHTTLWHPTDGGGWFAAQPNQADVVALHSGAHNHFFAVLSAILAIVAGGCYPLARRITRRLEALGQTVEGFGGGALDTRAAVQGRDEVAQLATQFNASAARIAALVAAQGRMLANASHELRSPIARLRMALEMLNESRISQTESNLIREGIASTTELDRLVGDILLASRMQAGAAERLRVDVGELIAHELRERQDVRYKPSPRPITLHGDPLALRSMLRNLVENALRYAKDDVEIALMPAGDQLRIRVSDRGPGVVPADRERIFEPYFRVAGHSEGQHGGVGLGLALVRDIARAHGGDVHHESRVGGGSSFIVQLPVDAGAD